MHLRSFLRTPSSLLAAAFAPSFLRKPCSYASSSSSSSPVVFAAIAPGMPARRSARLQALRAVASYGEELSTCAVLDYGEDVSAQRRRTRSPPARTVTQSSQESEDESPSVGGKRSKPSLTSEDDKGPDDEILGCLGRQRENSIRRLTPGIRYVMGIDEAGRGPLAGPVVAAAAIVPTDLRGIKDSKKITCEDERDRLYESIISSPNVRWAVAVVDAATIDNVNILQATLRGMRTAAEAVLSKDPKNRVDAPCATIEGCYVACDEGTTERADLDRDEVFALVDGNRLPKDMPCQAECIVKGDSKEYSIAAASILAKVTRDRLMHAYSQLYPQYNLAQHKGYPTAAHMGAIRQHGACAIHRRTFAPLKHMELDELGRIVSPSSVGGSDGNDVE